MYGFVEVWLAEYLGIDITPFGLNSGEEAAIVSRIDFSRIHSIMITLSQEQNRIPPQLFNSDVTGMRILSHEFWADDDVFDGLTGGDVKAHPTYMEIQSKGRSASRFDINELKEVLSARFMNGQLMGEQVGEPTVYTDVENGPVDIETADVVAQAIGAITADVDTIDNNLDTPIGDPILTVAEAVAAIQDGVAEPQTPGDALRNAGVQIDPNHAAVIDNGNGPQIVSTREVDTERQPGVYEADIGAAAFDTDNATVGIRITGGVGPVASGGANAAYNTNEDPPIRTGVGEAVRLAQTPDESPVETPPGEEGEMVEEAVEAVEKEDLFDDLINDATPQAEEVSSVPEVSPGRKFVERISDGVEVSLSLQGAYDVPDTDLQVIICDYGGAPKTEILIEFARTINKNVFVLTEQGTNVLRLLRKKLKDFNEVFSHSIFLCVYPHANSNAVLPPTPAFSLCFGIEVRKLYVVKGRSVQQQIDSVAAEHLSTDDYEEQIQRIRDSDQSSSYARFDQVFKDTATNVVWAVRDRCFVYLMFDPRRDRNLPVFESMMFELGRRFYGKMSYREIREIDLEYQKKIDLANREQYINFAVDSSKTVIKELRKQYEDARSKYRSFFDQAMEWAKLTQKYLDQIEAFDEEGFAAKEREKAQGGFDETMAIEKVSSIYVKEGVIHVYTHNIYAQDERTQKWHDIGTFHVQIGMMSNTYDQRTTVKIMNTKHQLRGMSEGMQAPHVFPEGYICHGNLATGMIEAYKRRDLFQLIMQIVLFLQTANTNDPAGKHVDKWPEVTDEVAMAVEEIEIEDDFAQISEAEKKFDDVLSEAIPLHI